MQLADEVIALQFGTPELQALREKAAAGDADALLKYVYFSAWQGIRRDKYIPHAKKSEVFRTLVESNMIEAALG